jgi:hypothetical protein
VPPAKARKNGFHSSKKTGKPDPGLTYNDDVVLRPSRGHDSEARGRQASFDKNQESARREA